MSKLRILLSIGANAFLVNIANAQGGSLSGSGNLITSKITTVQQLESLICTIAGWFFYFVLAISTLMMLWAAYTYVTAGDDTEKTSKARKIITYSAIGIAVALLADQLPAIIGSVLGASINGKYC